MRRAQPASRRIGEIDLGEVADHPVERVVEAGHLDVEPGPGRDQLGEVVAVVEGDERARVARPGCRGTRARPCARRCRRPVVRPPLGREPLLVGRHGEEVGAAGLQRAARSRAAPRRAVDMLHHVEGDGEVEARVREGQRLEVLVAEAAHHRRRGAAPGKNCSRRSPGTRGASLAEMPRVGRRGFVDGEARASPGSCARAPAPAPARAGSSRSPSSTGSRGTRPARAVKRTSARADRAEAGAVVDEGAARSVIASVTGGSRPGIRAAAPRRRARALSVPPRVWR